MHIADTKTAEENDIITEQRYAYRKCGGSKAELVSGDQVEMAEILRRVLATHYGATDVPAVADEGALYAYDPTRGIWREVLEQRLTTYVTALFHDAPIMGDGSKAPKSKMLAASDVRAVVDLVLSMSRQDGFFEGADRGIGFADWFAKVHRPAGGASYQLSLEPHSHEHRIRHGFDFPYPHSAPSPERYVRFLDETFAGCSDAADRIAALEGYLGLALVGMATRAEQWLYLEGNGADGKSTFLTIHAALFPEGSVCSIEPATLAGEYYRAQLAGKLLNVVNDVDKAKLSETGALKAAVSGNELSGRNPRGKPFYFKPCAGMVCAGNAPLETSDASHGFARRLVHVRFPNRVATERRDPHLAERILETEKAGIVWRVVCALNAILSRGCKVALPESSQDELSDIMSSADPVAEWLADKCVVGGAAPADGWPQLSQIYQSYRLYEDRTADDRSRLSLRQFGSSLQRHGVVRGRANGKRWVGLTLRSVI